MSAELVMFLNARLLEDEQAALAVPVAKGCIPPANWGTGSDPGGDERWVLGTYEDIDANSPAGAAHIARHDPARVLREITAKRRIIRECTTDVSYEEEGLANATLMLLALPYAGQPGYRREWAPEGATP